jgi:hypothetical protein
VHRNIVINSLCQSTLTYVGTANAVNCKLGTALRNLYTRSEARNSRQIKFSSIISSLENYCKSEGHMGFGSIRGSPYVYAWKFGQPGNIIAGPWPSQQPCISMLCMDTMLCMANGPNPGPSYFSLSMCLLLLVDSLPQRLQPIVWIEATIPEQAQVTTERASSISSHLGFNGD